MHYVSTGLLGTARYGTVNHTSTGLLASWMPVGIILVKRVKRFQMCTKRKRGNEIFTTMATDRTLFDIMLFLHSCEAEVSCVVVSESVPNGTGRVETQGISVLKSLRFQTEPFQAVRWKSSLKLDWTGMKWFRSTTGGKITTKEKICVKGNYQCCLWLEITKRSAFTYIARTNNYLNINEQELINRYFFSIQGKPNKIMHGRIYSCN